MTDLAMYSDRATLATSEAQRIGRLLGLDNPPADRVGLAARIATGLAASAASALSGAIAPVAGAMALIPEATLRRARNAKTPLSREMSERLYEVGRIVDMVSRIHHGDVRAISAFLNTPHPLLDDATPLDLARSSSAGADAVADLLTRAEAGFAV
ncbi:antitoxin Xre/MbcA/ParS toxin-binding domain-containing protein [Oceaniovalibus sp. ACAM 378]|uniref:antitoxin Xre/MbcA/ParS toxin-binding domain-containing protein n=1 Tax=Oceaniovalibus sp. ACAM 378 TaxID=2599923 RepID=UPI001651F1A9|nr:antitoxin Xre/MbcA/ParS toxin-binding domain-containing protein [Oceaniovalibus sp. ACAM 378]